MKPRRIEETLGRNLKRLRELRGVSQRQMANIAGVSQKTISNLEMASEKFSARLATIESVADYFGIEVGVLLLDNLSDDALTDPSVGEVIVKFAQLQPRHKEQIKSLINDLSQIVK